MMGIFAPPILHEMITTLLLLAVGLAALYGGGELLVRAAIQIGEWARLSPLVIGLTIVALGTSAPELAVSIDAALVGSSEIAIANVVGSNFANIALVLALSAAIAPIAVERLVLIRDLPVMLGAFLLITVMLVDRQIGRIDGLVLLLSLVVYLAYVILHSRQQRRAAAADLPGVHMSIPKTLGALAAGVVLLAVGGHWLVDAAVVLAASLGMSEAVIGMTVVAVGTSLPEVTASLIAVLRGHGSMAIGNVVGSNIWNALCVLGASALIVPLDQGEISAAMILAMIVSGLLLWVACRTHNHLSRIEGILLLAGYIACQWVFITT